MKRKGVTRKGNTWEGGENRRETETGEHLCAAEAESSGRVKAKRLAGGHANLL